MIFFRARQILHGRNDMKGMKVVVTAGPTREPLDPVRYISNYSSGKMGYAIADAARSFGAEVILISGPTQLAVPPGVNMIPVQTATQLQSEVHHHCAGADYLFMVAAVADFRPATFHRQKIKRSGESMRLILQPNPDILKTLGRQRPKFVVGFALETENLEAKAYDKLRDKKLDMIVANNPTEEGVEFGSDFNKATIIGRGDKPVKLERMTKYDLAVQIVEESIRRGRPNGAKTKR